MAWKLKCRRPAPSPTRQVPPRCSVSAGYSLEKVKTSDDEASAGDFGSPQRRPNYTALSYEDLEESWLLPLHHTYANELGPHAPPPMPVIVTPERSSNQQLHSKLTNLKKKKKKKRKGDRERLNLSQEKEPLPFAKDMEQEQQAMATPNFPQQES